MNPEPITVLELAVGKVQALNPRWNYRYSVTLSNGYGEKFFTFSAAMESLADAQAKSCS